MSVTRPAMSRALRAALLVSFALVCMDMEGRRAVHRARHEAPRDPATGVMAGAEPVRIERGRPRACLLLHGWISTPADFGDLTAALDRAGWDVHAPVHPGHGTEPSALEGVTADDLLDAARARYAELRGRYREVALVGFSMGGTIAMLLAGEEPPSRLVLIAPFLGVRHRWYYVLPARWWAAILAPLVRYVPRGRALARVNRPEGRAAALTYEAFPVEAAQALFALRRRAVARMQEGGPVAPALLVYSRGDEVCSRPQFERLWEALPAEARERAVFTRSNHHILLDYDREGAAAAVVRFLQRR